MITFLLRRILNISFIHFIQFFIIKYDLFHYIYSLVIFDFYFYWSF